MELTQEIVRELLDYDPETGKLYWRERNVKWFEDGYRTAQGNCNNWNGQHAGKEALATIDNYDYCYGEIFNKTYKAHRVIWLWFYGKWPDNQIDHLDGVTRNNRINNLNDKTQNENLKNQKFRKNNTSGFKGVCWDKRKNKWRAQIRADGKSKYLGLFSTSEQARAAYIEAATKLGFTERHIHGK